MKKSVELNEYAQNFHGHVSDLDPNERMRLHNSLPLKSNQRNGAFVHRVDEQKINPSKLLEVPGTSLNLVPGKNSKPC